ncbi:mechanosensitive ion channel domain-containing protein [Acidocella sp.]|uniref:mechanosensitive ion channel domain-containing protein n=1 Tax=Acidocella sp. TaxID=50710 RepID=UPI00261E8134|nr:mechanosensitive ion channel domain-containing protein [Acidocella sp.]
MRLPALLVLLALLLPNAASAAAPAATATPASAPASAPASGVPIIPGSPLAVLTAKAGAAPAPDIDAPFGTSALGFAPGAALAGAAVRGLGAFLDNLHNALRLKPVFTWAVSLPSQPAHRAAVLSLGRALGSTLLPALVCWAVIARLLRRPLSWCARKARPGPREFLPDADNQGLADAEAGASEAQGTPPVSVPAWARRVGFALLAMGLRLLPLLGFGLGLGGLLALGEPGSRAATLFVVGLGNGFLLWRGALVGLEVLVAPAAPSLRLVQLTTPRAQWARSWGGVLFGTVFAGYCLVSATEILGLAHADAAPLVKLVVLMVHVELVLAVWQARRPVARWLCGQPGRTGVAADLRRRLGAVWHWPVMIYVLALWLAWAGGVANAQGEMLRFVLVPMLGLVLGRLAWTGLVLALERLLPPHHHEADAPPPRHPLLHARARAYVPFMRLVLGAAILAGTVLLVLQGWGFGALGWLLADPLSHALISALMSIAVTLAAALTLWEAFNIALQARIERLTEAGRARHSARLRTLRPMLRTLVAIIVGTVAGLTGLAEIGVNATGLVAGASVIGIAVGFGSQKLVQDVITGLFLLLEDALQVGDYVSVGGLNGVVEQLSIRTIRLRGNDGSLNIIPFSSVGTVTNMTRDFSYAAFSVQLEYHADPRQVFGIIREVAAELRGDEVFGPMIRDDLQLYGLDELSMNGMVFTGRIRTGPGQHWAVRREFYARLKPRLDAAGVAFPYSYYFTPPAPQIKPE